MFLKKNKNIERGHKVVRHITDELDYSHDDSDHFDKE